MRKSKFDGVELREWVVCKCRFWYVTSRSAVKENFDTSDSKVVRKITLDGGVLFEKEVVSDT